MQLRRVSRPNSDGSAAPRTPRTSASACPASASRCIASVHQLVLTTPTRTLSLTSTSKKEPGRARRGRRRLTLGAVETSLDANRVQILPVAASAHAWVAHAGEHILLHDDPAVVVDLLEGSQYAREVDAALAELAEDAVPD